MTLLWPGPAPLWLLVLLVVVTAMGARARWSGSTWPARFHPSDRLGARDGRGQHRRVHGIPGHHRADRRGARPAGSRRAAGLHARRLPDRDVGAVPVLGDRHRAAGALPPQEPALRRGGATRRPSRPCAAATPCCPASRATSTPEPTPRVPSGSRAIARGEASPDVVAAAACRSPGRAGRLAENRRDRATYELARSFHVPGGMPPALAEHNFPARCQGTFTFAPESVVLRR